MLSYEQFLNIKSNKQKEVVMPQIKVLMTGIAHNMITPGVFPEMDRALTEAVETAFNIKGRHDVAFDVLYLPYTRGESPVQIGVIYTAGTDEYRTGRIFDPTKEEREAAAIKVQESFAAFLIANGIGPITPSVWIIPLYNSHFLSGQVEN